MKKSTIYLSILFTAFFFLFSSGKRASACNANFTFSNACAGDTVWFYAVDQFAVYTWDFGDNTAQTNINHDTATFHVYNTPGTYYVTLFVNVGAEFDYLTQVVTVGSNCFTAHFSSICGGSNYIYFTNQSVGSTSVHWNFGDAASGINDTSVLANPYHLYPSAGNYLVTIIASNGTVSDTSMQSVYVPVNCISASIYQNIWGNCYADSTAFNVSYTGAITSYLWNFDDPFSGADNTSTLAQPKHFYTAIGNYNVQLIITNVLDIDTIYKIIYVEDCGCWPGDVNDDGEVNAEDLFPIGMFYNNHGPMRPAASNSFTSQPIADWPNYNSWMYLQKFGNAKTADCNGDSTINMTDLSVINANYGMRHTLNNNRSSMPEATVADPTMYIQFPSGTASAGSTITGTIYLGTAAIPANNLYGYSFTILYDATYVVPGSTAINLSNNWLGNSSNELGIVYDDYSNGRIDAAVVRYDKVQVASGFGAIGTLTFQLSNGPGGTLHTSIDCTAKMLSTTMYASTASGNQEIFRPMNLLGADVNVLGSVGITTFADHNEIDVFPNPSNDLLTVKLNNTEATSLTIKNILGEIVVEENGNFSNLITVNTADFAKGIYILNCKTKNGLSVKKVSIIH